MGDMRGLPRINEIAAYLNQFAPSFADALKAKDKELAIFLEEGVIGGDEAVLPDQQHILLNLEAGVVNEALGQALADCRKDAKAASARLKALRVVRFVSSVCAAVGSSSVIGAAFAGTAWTIAAGGFTLLATLSSLFADNIVLGSREAEQTLREAVTDILQLSGEADLSQRWLAVLQTQRAFDPDQMKQLLASTNDLFHRLIGARSKVASTI